MEDDDIVKIKCPNCDRLYGVSLSALYKVQEVKFKCDNDSSCFSVSLKDGSLIVKPVSDHEVK
jgi:transposase-like protein